MSRDKLIRKRNLGIAGILIGLLITLLSLDTAVDAQKEIMRLDSGKLDEVRLK